jgi:glycerate 2-kinase
VKIVLAPDSFKESLSALEVATALEVGIRRVFPNVECIKVPMADGGEGTVDAMVSATGGRRLFKYVMGPLGERVRATYGLLGDRRTAVIEMAAASGLPLVPSNRRNPLKTTSFGTGELIRAALGKGARRVIIGIGGSATNDGGAGMAQALGVRFRDTSGAIIADGIAGGGLRPIHSIDLGQRIDDLAEAEILVACDVQNTLVGKSGATAVYGPQKGATAAQVAKLDQNLRHFGRLIERDLGIKVLTLKGGGAAGGLGAGLVAFAGGQLRSGVDLVVEAVDLPHHLDGADLVITGEGRIDSQTVFGKTPAGVAAAAARLRVPVVAVGGGLADDARTVFAHDIDALESAIVRDIELPFAMQRSKRYLRDAGERIAKWIVLGQKMARQNPEVDSSTAR